jgi:hypothetical protein
MPKILAQTSTQSEVNHVGSCWKCSKNILTLFKASGLSLKTPHAKIIMGADKITRTNSSLRSVCRASSNFPWYASSPRACRSACKSCASDIAAFAFCLLEYIFAPVWSAILAKPNQAILEPGCCLFSSFACSLNSHFITSSNSSSSTSNTRFCSWISY